MPFTMIYWYTHFSDTISATDALCADVGPAVMRMADADLLPYGLLEFADRFIATERMQKLLKDKQTRSARGIKDWMKAFSATADPKPNLLSRLSAEEFCNLNFAPLENAAEALTGVMSDIKKPTRSGENGDLALSCCRSRL